MLYDEKYEAEQAHDPKVMNNLPVVTVSNGEKILGHTLCVVSLGIFLIVGLVKKNKFKNLQMQINKAASNIEVQLQKRFDTLTKLVQSVKGHVNLDKEVFTTIAAYRSGMNPQAGAANQMNDINKNYQAIEKIQGALTMAFENYPELGANESIYTLNNESVMIEKEIAASRRYYNDLAAAFNGAIYQFPNNYFLRKLNYKGIPSFAASSESKKDVNISFN